MFNYLNHPRALVTRLVSKNVHCFDVERNEELYTAVAALPEPVRRGLSVLGRLRERRAGLASQLKAAQAHVDDLLDGDALDGAQRRAWSHRFRDGAATLKTLDRQVAIIGAELLAMV